MRRWPCSPPTSFPRCASCAARLPSFPRTAPHPAGFARCVLAASSTMTAPWCCSRKANPTRRSCESCATSSPHSYASEAPASKPFLGERLSGRQRQAKSAAPLCVCLRAGIGRAESVTAKAMEGAKSLDCGPEELPCASGARVAAVRSAPRQHTAHAAPNVSTVDAQKALSTRRLRARPQRPSARGTVRLPGQSRLTCLPRLPTAA
jgi:hypothetical protein